MLVHFNAAIGVRDGLEIPQFCGTGGIVGGTIGADHAPPSGSGTAAVAFQYGADVARAAAGHLGHLAIGGDVAGWDYGNDR